MAKMGLVAAMESEREAEAAREQSEQIELPAAVDSLETQMLEVQETVRELEERVEAIDEAIEDTEVLERVKERMEESVEEGGMSADTAEMAEIAVESIKARLGISGKAFSGVSMESFGNKATRIGATKLGLEDVKENLKKAWDAIIAALQKAYEWVVKFLKEVFTAQGRMKKRAENVKAAARAIVGDAEKKTVKAGNLANSLSLGGKFDASAVAKGVSATSDVAGNLGDMCGASAQIWDIVTQATADNINDVVMDVAEAAVEATDLVKNWKVVDDVFVSDELPGNRVVTIVAKETSLAGMNKKVVKKASVEAFNPTQAKVKDEEIAVASKSEINAIADAVLNAVKTLERIKANQEKLAASLKSAQATMKKLSVEAEKDNSKSAAFNAIRTGLAGAVGEGVSYMSVMNKVVVSVGKSALDYAEVSLMQYKESAREIQKALGKADKAATAASAAA